MASFFLFKNPRLSGASSALHPSHSLTHELTLGSVFPDCHTINIVRIGNQLLVLTGYSNCARAFYFVDAAGFEPADSEIDSTATLNPNFKRVVLTSFAVNRASTIPPRIEFAVFPAVTILQTCWTIVLPHYYTVFAWRRVTTARLPHLHLIFSRTKNIFIANIQQLFHTCNFF